MVLPDTIDISDDRLAAIKAKVEAYDWSQLPDAGGWTSGVGVNDLKRLVAYWRPKRFFEYWGHEASLLSIDCQPLLRWRMARALRDRGVWRQLEPLAGEKRGEAEALQSEMAFYG